MALSLDTGLATGQANNAAAVSTSAGKSSAAGAIIIVTTHAEWLHAVGAAGTVSSVTGGGLTFQNRAGLTLAGVSGADAYSRLEVWWAYTSPGNTTITYTVNYNLPSSTNFESAVVSVQSVIGFTGGTYSTNPWDSNGSLPAVASAEVSGSPTVTGVSTTSANTMLFATVGDAPASGGLSTTPPTSFSFIQGIRNTTGAVNNSEIATDYEVVSSAQSSITVAWPGAVINWTAIIDALAQAGGVVSATDYSTGGQYIFRVKQGWRF